MTHRRVDPRSTPPAPPSGSLRRSWRSAARPSSFFAPFRRSERASPCAKPGARLGGPPALQHEGVGVRRLRPSARSGSKPSDPRHHGHPPKPGVFHPDPVHQARAGGWCTATPHVNGEPWKFAPRVILRRMLERAAERELSAFVGCGGGVLPGPPAGEDGHAGDRGTPRGHRRPAPVTNARRRHPDVRFTLAAVFDGRMNRCLGWANLRQRS